MTVEMAPATVALTCDSPVDPVAPKIVEGRLNGQICPNGEIFSLDGPGIDCAPEQYGSEYGRLVVRESDMDFPHLMKALEFISNQICTNLQFTKALYRGTKKSITGPGNEPTRLHSFHSVFGDDLKVNSKRSQRSEKSNDKSEDFSSGTSWNMSPSWAQRQHREIFGSVHNGNLRNNASFQDKGRAPKSGDKKVSAPIFPPLQKVAICNSSVGSQRSTDTVEEWSLCGSSKNCDSSKDEAYSPTSRSIKETMFSSANTVSSVLYQHHVLQSRRSVQVWRFMEDQNSSQAALVYFQLRNVLLALSVLVACVEIFNDNYSSNTSTAYVQLGIEASFAVELIARFCVCGDRIAFLLAVHNFIDFMSVFPAGIRIYVLATEEGTLATVSILGAVPVFRLLKLLRHFDSFQLLWSAFRSAAEALPMLLFTMFLLASSFATLIYYCEPRDSIPSLTLAVYFSVITVSTVGYGDFSPTTRWGRIWTCMLSIIGPMYMAIPIGIIGHAFSEVWEDRHRLLVLQQMRRCVNNAGYTPKELRLMFEVIDVNKDGTLDFDEFAGWLDVINVRMPESIVRQVFESFDVDDEGTVDFQELLRGLFPHTHSRVHQLARQISEYVANMSGTGSFSSPSSSSLPSRS